MEGKAEDLVRRQGKKPNSLMRAGEGRKDGKGGNFDLGEILRDWRNPPLQ